MPPKPTKPPQMFISCKPGDNVMEACTKKAKELTQQTFTLGYKKTLSSLKFGIKLHESQTKKQTNKNTLAKHQKSLDELKKAVKFLTNKKNQADLKNKLFKSFFEQCINECK